MYIYIYIYTSAYKYHSQATIPDFLAHAFDSESAGNLWHGLTVISCAVYGRDAPTA